MSNNYAPYFNRIDFAIIPSYIERPWLNLKIKAYIILGINYFNQSAFTCSILTIETLEQGVKYVQS